MSWQLPEDSLIYNLSNGWRMPVYTAITYATIVTILSRRNDRMLKANPPQLKTKGKAEPEPWTLFKASVVAHNILLALFSACIFCNVLPLLLAGFRYRSFHNAFCDVGGWVYNNGIGFWTWAFYMSKYYELIDTAILLAKGKSPSFLQTFHHTGAIISMWMLVTSRAFGAWVFVLFNSFIHSVMYFYYTLTCFGYQPKWKKLMTGMQLTQFFIGLPLACVFVIIPKCVPVVPHPKDVLAKLWNINGYWTQVSALMFSFVYVCILIGLFLDFARRTYRPSSSSNNSDQNDKTAKAKSKPSYLDAKKDSASSSNSSRKNFNNNNSNSYTERKSKLN